MYVLKDVQIQIVAREACGRIGRRRKSGATCRLRVAVHCRIRCDEEGFATEIESARVVVMR